MLLSMPNRILKILQNKKEVNIPTQDLFSFLSCVFGEAKQNPRVFGHGMNASTSKRYPVINYA
jgi:hypothetical protein